MSRNFNAIGARGWREGGGDGVVSGGEGGVGSEMGSESGEMVR